MSRINWPRFLNLALLFSLVGCTSFDPASPQPTQIAEVSTPLLSPTAVPPYIHYDSSKGPNIHLEFDYPGSWIFGTRIEADMVIISLADPRFLTLPTPSYDGIHPVPNDFGSVDIWVMPLQAGQTPDTELESHKKSYSETWWIKVLDDYKTTIDGYDANVLEYQVNDPEGYAPMFERRIFFVIGDHIYEIFFDVAVKDRGGEFEQGYEYFFNSLKVVP
jgi:hypothetical protein